ncbi:MAG TPA: winged helix-turn-helix transcriptional regulator [Clostridia bacterium]|nr:winged helix-turn-helix transcriptional regulator [Clostridia bacterium]
MHLAEDAASSIHSQPGGIYSVGDIAVDVDRHEVTLAGKRVELTPKEFELLLAFVKNPGKVLTRDFLLDTIWGYDFYGDTRVVDVHVSHLRDKIEEDPVSPRYLKTVRGVGYKLECA